MRKVIPGSLILLVVMVILGCSVVKKSVDYYEVCKGDTECLAKMQRAYNVSSVLSRDTINSLPFTVPFSDYLVQGVALLFSTLVGVVYGRRYTRKKQSG